MEKKNKRNNHMMNKGMKQKVSVLLILCLLLTGYHGLTISGKAEQSEKKESNCSYQVKESPPMIFLPTPGIKLVLSSGVATGLRRIGGAVTSACTR